ncbi:hypothetical protein OG921_00155 [Aldersonia sp. NBC_00410]|uniref:hypothetical protein n=1 Tax=Aldersonia sp. NBC_00410 TaxID=2975954 RepID=UPI00224F7826|nr:hypothetical protein [Aldersonia sp. NBC_00410]MCX5041603.1 hypothetical protein [Aldersonia sp. NBC_00410]
MDRTALVTGGAGGRGSVVGALLPTDGRRIGARSPAAPAIAGLGRRFGLESVTTDRIVGRRVAESVPLAGGRASAPILDVIGYLFSAVSVPITDAQVPVPGVGA